jgi:hypothetical protein
MPLFQPFAASMLLALGAPGAPPTSAPPLSVQADDFAAQWRTLQEEYEAAQEQFMEAFRERFAKFDYEKATPEEQDEYQRFWTEGQPGPKFLPRFEAFAVKAKGSDAAVEAWGMVLNIGQQSGDEQAPLRALEALLGCVESPAMQEVAANLRYAWGLPADKVRSLLEALREKSPHRGVKAAATFSLASTLMEGGDEDAKKRARALFVELNEKYADVKGSRGDRSYAQMAEGMLFELDHLQIGMIAPDMEGIDVDGVKFKLSDFRGKVTVVDFWGYW